jgi:hypothetical protein
MYLNIKGGNNMSVRRTVAAACTMFLTAGLLFLPAGQVGAQDKAAATAPPAPQGKPTMAKACSNCHQPLEGSLRGYFENVSYKAQSIQIKIDDATEIVRFDPATLKVVNVKGENPEEPLRDIKKGHDVRIEYTEKNGEKFATAVFSKPPIKVAPEKLMSTAEVEKLVAQGPEKGKYLLIDARPAPRFMAGAIPTAINIPFPAFDKMVDKLPKDKNAFIIYYCAGLT